MTATRTGRPPGTGSAPGQGSSGRQEASAQRVAISRKRLLALVLITVGAIAAAVLGGCSLRGGEGMVAGMLLGTMVLPLLSNLCQFARIPSDVEYTVIGGALLLGTIADELLKRFKRRKTT